MAQPYEKKTPFLVALAKLALEKVKHLFLIPFEQCDDKLGLNFTNFMGELARENSLQKVIPRDLTMMKKMKPLPP